MNKTIIKNLYLTINIMSDRQDTPCGSEQKRSDETDEVKTHNDGVFICTESKELFPPSEWDGSKGKAIGVAIIEGEKRLLVALKSSDKDLVLLDEGKDSGLEPYPTVSKARKDTDGRNNTEALLKAGSEAAKFCKELGGKWYIPTLNDMELMHSHQDELDEALEKAGGKSLYDGWHWTCTRQSDSCYFVFNWYNGNRNDFNQVSNFRVRPVSLFLTFQPF